jgi:hypothetical protein
MRGSVFSDLIAATGAHSGALHDVIPARRFYLLSRAMAALCGFQRAFASVRILNKQE